MNAPTRAAASECAADAGGSAADGRLCCGTELDGEATAARSRWTPRRCEAGTPIDAANARRFVLIVARDAGIGHLTPYELRHAHASILSDTGAHAEALADRMGHRDSRTTLAHYRHQLAPVIEVGAGVDFTLTATK